MGLETPTNNSAEKFKDITRRCLAVLDKYTSLSLKPEEFEAEEKLFRRERLTQEEVAEFGSRGTLGRFLSVMRDILQTESIDTDIRDWIHEELTVLEERVRQNGKVEVGHLKAATLILREFLHRLYGDVLVQNIRLAVMTPEEREAIKRKTATESIDAQELKKQAALFLYEYQYLWDYYPDIPKRLGLTGDKRSDIEKVQNEEYRLTARYFDTNWEITFARLREIIAQGKDPEGGTLDDAILFYKLTTNKIRTAWFQQLPGYVENLADLGFPLEHLVERTTELRDRIRDRRHVSPDGGDFSPVPVTEQEVEEGEKILDEIFRIVYPHVVADDGVTIDRRKLEQELDIATQDSFFENLKKDTEKYA